VNCKKFQSVIALNLVDGLPDSEASETEKHLESCPVCRQYYEALKEQSLAVFQNASPGGPSPETWSRIKHRIFEKQIACQEAQKKRFTWRSLPRWALALPVLAVVFTFQGKGIEPGFKALPETEYYLIGEVGLSGDSVEAEELLNFGSAAEDFLI